VAVKMVLSHLFADLVLHPHTSSLISFMLQVYKGVWRDLDVAVKLMPSHLFADLVLHPHTSSLISFMLQVYKGVWRGLDVAVKMVLFQARGRSGPALMSSRPSPAIQGTLQNAEAKSYGALLLCLQKKTLKRSMCYVNQCWTMGIMLRCGG